MKDTLQLCRHTFFAVLVLSATLGALALSYRPTDVQAARYELSLLEKEVVPLTLRDPRTGLAEAVRQVDCGAVWDRRLRWLATYLRQQGAASVRFGSSTHWQLYSRKAELPVPSGGSDVAELREALRENAGGACLLPTTPAVDSLLRSVRARCPGCKGHFLQPLPSDSQFVVRWHASGGGATFDTVASISGFLYVESGHGITEALDRRSRSVHYELMQFQSRAGPDGRFPVHYLPALSRFPALDTLGMDEVEEALRGIDRQSKDRPTLSIFGVSVVGELVLGAGPLLAVALLAFLGALLLHVADIRSIDSQGFDTDPFLLLHRSWLVRLCSHVCLIASPALAVFLLYQRLRYTTLLNFTTNLAHGMIAAGLVVAAGFWVMRISEELAAVRSVPRTTRHARVRRRIWRTWVARRMRAWWDRAVRARVRTA